MTSSIKRDYPNRILLTDNKYYRVCKKKDNGWSKDINIATDDR